MVQTVQFWTSVDEVPVVAHDREMPQDSVLRQSLRTWKVRTVHASVFSWATRALFLGAPVSVRGAGVAGSFTPR